MRLVRGSAASSSAFVVVAALGVLSASAQLNPTVKVLSKPQAAVPPECEQGLAPAQPRVMIAETQPEEPKTTRATAPPQLDLKTRLRAVQVAAEQNDREAFKSALADARPAVASYPAGGERDAANAVLTAYSDLERLWDYAFTSPTGAFFDASSDSGAVLVNAMRRYPEYPKAVSESTLNVRGQTIYPTRETRQFLTAEASRRLARLGVRTPTRIVETPTPAPQPRVLPAPVPVPKPTKPAVSKPTTKTARAHPPKATTSKPKPKPVTTTAKPTTKPTTTPKPKPVTKIAEAKPSPPQPRHVEPTPTPTPMPAPKPAPVSRPSPVPAPVQPAPVPVPVPTPAPKPAPQPSPVSTTTLEPAPTATETTATATATTTASPEQKPQRSGGVNLLVAIILIIIGIGVLIVLFRASD